MSSQDQASKCKFASKRIFFVFAMQDTKSSLNHACKMLFAQNLNAKTLLHRHTINARYFYLELIQLKRGVFLIMVQTSILSFLEVTRRTELRLCRPAYSERSVGVFLWSQRHKKKLHLLNVCFFSWEQNSFANSVANLVKELVNLSWADFGYS